MRLLSLHVFCHPLSVLCQCDVAVTQLLSESWLLMTCSFWSCSRHEASCLVTYEPISPTDQLKSTLLPITQVQYTTSVPITNINILPCLSRSSRTPFKNLCICVFHQIPASVSPDSLVSEVLRVRCSPGSRCTTRTGASCTLSVGNAHVL